MKRWLGLLVIGGLCAAPAPAAAQAAWDAPLLAAPTPMSGLGLYIMDAAGGDIGVMGTYRGSPHGVELRLGIADEEHSDISVFGGLAAQIDIARATRNFPLDVSGVGGIGAGFGGPGDNVLVDIPLGVSLGHTFNASGTRITPYVGPHLIVSSLLGAPGDDDLDLGLAADLGVDVGFQPGRALRFSASIGDREAIALGLVF